jgi:hypothetical protein
LWKNQIPDTSRQNDAAPPPQEDASDRTKTEAAHKRWESAIDDPEARAFLKRAMERRAQMTREGLIHRP